MVCQTEDKFKLNKKMYGLLFIPSIITIVEDLKYISLEISVPPSSILKRFNAKICIMQKYTFTGFQ